MPYDPVTATAKECCFVKGNECSLYVAAALEGPVLKATLCAYKSQRGCCGSPGCWLQGSGKWHNHALASGITTLPSGYDAIQPSNALHLRSKAVKTHHMLCTCSTQHQVFVDCFPPQLESLCWLSARPKKLCSGQMLFLYVHNLLCPAMSTTASAGFTIFTLL